MTYKHLHIIKIHASRPKIKSREEEKNNDEVIFGTCWRDRRARVDIVLENDNRRKGTKLGSELGEKNGLGVESISNGLRIRRGGEVKTSAGDDLRSEEIGFSAAEQLLQLAWQSQNQRMATVPEAVATT
jgi:hypothetical protein